MVRLDLTVVAAGAVFGFLGPNGVGKTTTIRLLLDLIRPTSGTAQVLGLHAHRDSIAIRRRVGYLPGEYALYPRLTGDETLRYLGGLRDGVDGSKVAALAERLGLSRRAGDLSTGNKRRLGLIQAFMHEPELLILDEPTGGLDPLAQRDFYHMVDEARERGQTIFLCSHVLPEVERVCERVGSVHKGRLDTVVKAAARHEVVALTSREPDLEDLFRGPLPHLLPRRCRRCCVTPTSRACATTAARCSSGRSRSPCTRCS